jgi:hypothetical protein
MLISGTPLDDFLTVSRKHELGLKFYRFEIHMKFPDQRVSFLK